MYAAVLTEYNHIEWKEVPRPKITGDEVLVRVAYASICGTDQHIVKGEFHPRTHTPFIPGHEFAGTVAEVGGAVEDYQPGDRVAVDPVIWCGECPACEIGHYPACSTLKLLGVDMDGGFGQFVAARPGMLYKLPENTSLRDGALVEVLAIGFHACRRAGLAAGDSVAIWGAGKVGQCILQAARTKTQEVLFLVDILEERLARAKKAYPDAVVINARETDPVAAIMEQTDGRGVDIAIEAVGHAHPVPGIPTPVRACIQSIRGAGTVCVLGLSDEPAPIVFKEMIYKEAKIIASRVTHGEFAEVIENLERGALKPEALISEILPAEKAGEGFEMLERHPADHLKVLLDFG